MFAISQGCPFLRFLQRRVSNVNYRHYMHQKVICFSFRTADMHRIEKVTGTECRFLSFPDNQSSLELDTGVGHYSLDLLISACLCTRSPAPTPPSPQCSIGLRSGDCGGHLSKVNSLSCSRNQSEMI